MDQGRKRVPLQGASRFSLEDNYEEFERVHGFDIRDRHSEFPETNYQDTRDTRDPQRLGEELLNRKDNGWDKSILEYADMIESLNRRNGRMVHGKIALPNKRS